MSELFFEVQDRSFADRLRLNYALLNNKYWYLPVDDRGHEDFMPVGRGVQSSEFCSRWVGSHVCKDVESHKGVVIDGVDCTDKVVVVHKHMWCKKSTCPVCFNRGWSVEGARSVDSRLSEAERVGLGKVEHITVSAPVGDRDLPVPILKKRCRSALVDRGVIDCCMIFYGYRMDKERTCLEWSPHYHVLGFIKGDSFDRCRGCIHTRDDCASCDGFKGREVRGFAKDGYLVKVHAERESVFGSAHYQLNHATVKVGIRRFHVVSWFGKLSSRGGLKVEREKAVISCPACGGEMSRSVYVGCRFIVKDVGSPDYVSWFVDDEFGRSG